jgi:hypothetical protein
LKQGLIWNFERIRKISTGIRGIWEMKFGILVDGDVSDSGRNGVENFLHGGRN